MESPMPAQPAEAPVIDPEAIKQELDFLNTEHLTELRQDQKDELAEARATAIDSVDPDEDWPSPIKLSQARKEATGRVLGQIDDEYKKYLDKHMNRDDNPDRYDRVLDSLRSTSIEHMSDIAWNLGEPDEEGNYSRPETSGRAKAGAALDDLAQEIGFDRLKDLPPPPPPPPDLPPPPDAPTLEQYNYIEAEQKLSNTRDKLAELSIALRGKVIPWGKRSWSKKNTALRVEYEEAAADYENAYTELGRASVEMLRAQNPDITGDELKAKVVEGTITERHAFAQAEWAVLENDQSTWGKVARFLARPGRGIVAGVTGGAVLGGFTGKVAKAVATGAAIIAAPAAAVPVAIAAGVLSKTSRAALTGTVGRRVNQNRLHGRRTNEDIQIVKENALAALSTDLSHAEDWAVASSDELTGNIDTRINKDRRSNQKRMVAAVAISSLAGLAGAWATDHLGQVQPPSRIEHLEVHGRPFDPNWSADQRAEWFNWMHNNPNDSLSQAFNHMATDRNAAQRYFEWVKDFKAARPTLQLPSGGEVNVHDNPALYESRMQDLWMQYHQAIQDAAKKTAGVVAKRGTPQYTG